MTDTHSRSANELITVAYADPPYLGCCKYYEHYHPDGRCWDDLETHRLLIERLCDEYPDGWALSLHEPSRRYLEPFTPADTRMGVWLKSFASFKPNVDPAHAWEPVFFRGGRRRGREYATTRDFLVCPITLQKGLTGVKPREFCFWTFDLLGAMKGDELADLFPGSGVVGECWSEFQGRPEPKNGQEALAV